MQSENIFQYSFSRQSSVYFPVGIRCVRCVCGVGDRSIDRCEYITVSMDLFGPTNIIHCPSMKTFGTFFVLVLAPSSEMCKEERNEE